MLVFSYHQEQKFFGISPIPGPQTLWLQHNHTNPVPKEFTLDNNRTDMS